MNEHDPFQNPKSFPAPRFLVGGVTLLLGASTQAAAANILGLSLLVIMVLVTALLTALRGKIARSAEFPLALAVSTLLATVLDFILSMVNPTLRASLGIYLSLTAVSPLILEPWATPSETPSLTKALVTGLQFWVVLVILAVIRELLGSGHLSLWPFAPEITLAGFSTYAPAVLMAASGAFFLTAAGIVLGRLWQRQRTVPARPRQAPRPMIKPVPVPEPTPIFEPKPEPISEPSSQVPEIEDIPPTEEISPSTLDTWGENLESVLREAIMEPAEKRRFLVLGCGTGELAWHVAMFALSAQQKQKTDFRVRATDPFAVRLETAREGVYHEHQFSDLAEPLKQAYLLRSREENHHLVRISEAVRNYVEFDQADFETGRLFFYKTADVIILNQSLEGLSLDRQRQILENIVDDLVPKGALVLRTELDRSALPETLRRTGDHVFRRD
ncbi:MAG: hypothetical protein HKM05_09915 [Spirochaetales bacterium]|nr:hypothetical protein [Spirochaetales bacterium]